MFKILIAIISIGGFTSANASGIQNATQFESPWLALITIGNQRCGGSLIKNKFIITAAHCFDGIRINNEVDLNSIKVKLGEWKTEMDPDCNPNVSGEACDNVAVIPVDEIVIHKDYLRANPANKYKSDIAIISLAWKPRKSPVISNIELPVYSRCVDDMVGEKWDFTGFGQIRDGVFTTIKKKMEMYIISNEQCRAELGTTQGSFLKVTHICGKNLGAQTCKGDSGSAVTRNVLGTSYLEGIVSFGAERCGNENIPTGLLKVSCFIDWIQTQIKNLA